MVRSLLSTLLLLALIITLAQNANAAGLAISPETVQLRSPEATQQLLVSRPSPTPGVSPRADATRQASYRSLNQEIATVDATGLVQARGDGKTEIVIEFSGEEMRVPVEVTGVAQPEPVSFRHQIIPILTKSSCNSGGCHGKAEGQNGFKLSVFGFDAKADYEAIVQNGRGRRVRVTTPSRSLMLLKGTAEVPHGGGLKMELGSLAHRRFLRWIREGAQLDEESQEAIVRIEVEPEVQSLAVETQQQLRVTAIDAHGVRHCVTAEAEYESNAGVVAEVDRRGLVQATNVPGEAAILVRFLEHVAVARITIPRRQVEVKHPPVANFIDQLAWDKLERLGIPASEQAADGEFLRRMYLDVLGVLPTAKEAAQFLASTDPQKRAKAIDAALNRPEYADYWAMRFADILRVDRSAITAQGAVAMTRWLHRQFEKNRPYDAIVHDILTARGNTLLDGPASFYKALATAEETSRSVSQVFLGVRIECAQCHHHPAERWGQDDYVALAGFFTGIKHKRLTSGGEVIVAGPGTDLKHPRTGEVVLARPLGGEAVEFEPQEDRRVALADWVTSGENPYFAQALTNRLWAHYLGRGLVEPIDDIRATNPATNEPLLAELAKHLVDVKFDLKQFTRTVLNSQLYQRAGESTLDNQDDAQNFSHARPKALPAEVLLDAVCQVTGVSEKFNGWPDGYRAVQVWDNRMPSYFFRIFGRPTRVSVCECERSNEPSIAQALHLLNSPELSEKLSSRRSVTYQLATNNLSNDEIVDQLFLSALTRYPNQQERALFGTAFADVSNQDDRRALIEDALWTLINTKEFLFNH